MKQNSAYDQEVYNQKGGAVEINYGVFQIVAPRNDLLGAVKLWQECDSKAEMLRSIEGTIAFAMPLVAAGTATQEQAMNLCQDIMLWYANEINEGRADNTGLFN